MTATSDAFKNIVPPLLRHPLPLAHYCNGYSREDNRIV